MIFDVIVAQSIFKRVFQVVLWRRRLKERLLYFSTFQKSVEHETFDNLLIAREMFIACTYYLLVTLSTIKYNTNIATLRCFASTTYVFQGRHLGGGGPKGVFHGPFFCCRWSDFNKLALPIGIHFITDIIHF